MRFHKWINVLLFIAAFGSLGYILGGQIMTLREHAKMQEPKINVVENPPGITIPFAPPEQLAPTINQVRDPIH